MKAFIIIAVVAQVAFAWEQSQQFQRPTQYQRGMFDSGKLGKEHEGKLSDQLLINRKEREVKQPKLFGWGESDKTYKDLTNKRVSREVLEHSREIQQPKLIKEQRWVEPRQGGVAYAGEYTVEYSPARPINPMGRTLEKVQGIHSRELENKKWSGSVEHIPVNRPQEFHSTKTARATGALHEPESQVRAGIRGQQGMWQGEGLHQGRIGQMTVNEEKERTGQQTWHEGQPKQRYLGEQYGRY